MIPHDTVSTIISTARIEEIVGDFVMLKRRGVNYLGLCPFHNEKTPSFTVSPAKGIFKCFGCGKSGNTVNFLMEHEHFTYPEALKFLAKRYHIDIVEEEQTAEQIQEQNEKESLFLLNQFAQQYFTGNLSQSEEGKAVGLTYLKERDFTEETIKKFGLGYALTGWDDFSNHATRQGYKAEYLVKTGLSVQKESRLIDRFHGRVIFPIQSASGRILGFGGRILTGDKNVAKYLNSPESEIYNKSKTLYGIYFAKNALVSKNNCFLVEGYTDVISLHQCGIENVVASSGTSLTHEQVKLIQRYTSNITILYDGDPAGIKASMRGIDMILEQGMNVKIVLFPEGEDPDSFARKNRVAEVEAFIKKNAVDFILFKTRLLLEETKGDPAKRLELIKEIVSTISLIPEVISRSIYIKECASKLDVPEQSLLNDLNKLLRKKRDKNLPEEPAGNAVSPDISSEPAQKQTDYDFNSCESYEIEIIRLVILYGHELLTFQQENEDKEMEDFKISVSEVVVQDIHNDEIVFENPVCQKIFNELVGFYENKAFPEKDYFFHHPDQEVSAFAIGQSIEPYGLSENWKANQIYVDHESDQLNDVIYAALLGFKAKKIERMMGDLQKSLKENPPEEDVLILMEKLKRLKSTSMDINEKLGRIVIR